MQRTITTCDVCQSEIDDGVGLLKESDFFRIGFFLYPAGDGPEMEVYICKACAKLMRGKDLSPWDEVVAEGLSTIVVARRLATFPLQKNDAKTMNRKDVHRLVDAGYSLLGHLAGFVPESEEGDFGGWVALLSKNLSVVGHELEADMEGPVVETQD